MLAMKAFSLILLSALCLLCISSNDEQYFENSCEESDFRETHTLKAPLGSSVLLPCLLSTTTANPVSWKHLPETELVHITSEGLINFVDPRYGRVKAFPNQGSNGNYSIFIDDLENSDLGCYRCRQGKDCLQVELVPDLGVLHERMLLLIYTFVGAAAFILLTVGGYCCMKSRFASSTPEEMVGKPVEDQQRGTDNLVYENDDQDPAHQLGDPARSHCSLPVVLPDLNRTYLTQSTSGICPNMNQFNCENMENQRTKQRFHTGLFSRLRQPSLIWHYYANQDEISKQQAYAENHVRDCEYKNSIYNKPVQPPVENQGRGL